MLVLMKNENNICNEEKHTHTKSHPLPKNIHFRYKCVCFNNMLTKKIILKWNNSIVFYFFFCFSLLTFQKESLETRVKSHSPILRKISEGTIQGRPPATTDQKKRYKKMNCRRRKMGPKSWDAHTSYLFPFAKSSQLKLCATRG